MAGLYRKNVGIVVFKNKRVLLCARADHEDFQWQFPQGGIEENEDVVAAAKRELFEETGIKNVLFVSKLPRALRYDFPKNNKNHFYEGFVGQEQSWVLFQFCGNDDEINLKIFPECVEFKDFEWVDINEAPKRIVSFKKNVYSKVAEYFAPIINEVSND